MWGLSVHYSQTALTAASVNDIIPMLYYATTRKKTREAKSNIETNTHTQNSSKNEREKPAIIDMKEPHGIAIGIYFLGKNNASFSHTQPTHSRWERDVLLCKSKESLLKKPNRKVIIRFCKSRWCDLSTMLLLDLSPSALFGVILATLATVALCVRLHRRKQPPLPPMAPNSLWENIKRSGYPSLPHKVEVSEW